MNRKGYVRRWRDLYDSPIYQDKNWWRLYDYLESHVNWKDGRLRDGTVVSAGSLVSSREHLARETGLTVQQLRGAITGLRNAGFLTSETTSRYTALTLTNWTTDQGPGEAIQPTEEPTEQPAGNQPITSKQPADNHNQRRESFKKRGKGNHQSMIADPRSPTVDPSLTNLSDITLLRTEVGLFMEKEANAHFIRDLMKALIKFEVPTMKYLIHLRSLPSFCHPGGSAGPKHWSWFLAVAKDLSNKCEHGNPKDGDCFECDAEVAAE